MRCLHSWRCSSAVELLGGWPCGALEATPSAEAERLAVQDAEAAQKTAAEAFTKVPGLCIASITGVVETVTRRLCRLDTIKLAAHTTSAWRR